MIKRIAALVMALFLMASFYLYALLQEDEETKRTDQWVVAGDDSLTRAQERVISTDPAVLAGAMGLSLPLPRELSSGEVKDGQYHGYRVRQLEAESADATVLGVRPASAAPLIRGSGLQFEATDKTLMSYPLLRAEMDGSAYYYLASEQAAFIIRLPLHLPEEAALSGFILAQP